MAENVFCGSYLSFIQYMEYGDESHNQSYNKFYGLFASWLRMNSNLQSNNPFQQLIYWQWEAMLHETINKNKWFSFSFGKQNKEIKKLYMYRKDICSNGNNPSAFMKVDIYEKSIPFPIIGKNCKILQLGKGKFDSVMHMKCVAVSG